jgi:hypothetical protein
MPNHMRKIRVYFIVFLISTSTNLCYSQIPTIRSVGGDGRYVDWPKIKAEVEEEEKLSGGGPGYFYNDCDQTINPISASSTLPNQGKYNYRIKNINDFDPMTAWVEGKPDYGIGEYFEIKALGLNVIYNGYQASPKSWVENSRVKKFKVYKNNISLCYLILTDEMGRQSFELPDHNRNEDSEESIYKFEIIEVYKGSKWQDVAISEITLAGCCIGESSSIETISNNVSIGNVEPGLFIKTINLKTGELSNSEVLKVSKQRHLSMLKIRCETKELELTSNHPLFIKDFGFSSINKYMEFKNITDYKDLIDKIEFGVWDESKGGLYYEKLKEIKLINGVFETFTIGKIAQGNSYISNGFISKIY